jgi:hypothetical protein
LKSLDAYVEEAEQTIRQLKDKLANVTLERDMYKRMLVEEGELGGAWMTIYSKDNGEGVDTETCVGVFTTNALAIQAILDVCAKNKDVCVDSFRVEDLKTNSPFTTGQVVKVMHYDEEMHCEVATVILDINEDTKGRTYTDCYAIEYTVDTVYHIE